MPRKINIGREVTEDPRSAFPTQEEITKETSHEEVSDGTAKDLEEHRNSSLLDHKFGSVDFQHFTVRLRAMFERLFGEETLDNVLSLLEERAFHPETQRVLHGRTDSSGDPEFLSEENIGNVTFLTTTVPALLAFAYGFNERGIVRYIKQVIADVEPTAWKNLLGLTKHFLYVDYDLDTGEVSYEKTLVPIQYSRMFDPTERFSQHSLLHFEEDTTPIDEYGTGLNPVTWTASGAVRSAVQKRWGEYSYLFDGANDYIETTNITDLQRPFTIELEFYSTNDTQAQNIVGNKGTYGFRCIYRGDVAGDYVDYWVSSDGANWDIMNTIDGAITVTKDEWHKLTFEWDGYFYRGYIDGVLDMETASAVPMNILTGIQIGNYNSDGASAFLGYIDEFRLTIGNCRYGTAHNVETAAFSPDAQWFDTQNMKWYEGKPGSWTEKKRLVLGQANADRRVGALLHFNAAADTTDWTKLLDEYGNKWTFGGTAKLDTDDNAGGNVAPKFGNRFVWFDGNSDYITYDRGVNDSEYWPDAWTIEFWWYTGNKAQDSQAIIYIVDTLGGFGIYFRFDSDTNTYLFLSSNGTAWDITNANASGVQVWANYTWYKFTLRWDGTTYKVYRGTTEIHSIASTSEICPTRYIRFGSANVGNYHNGGVDEARITRGHDVYGGAPTEETEEFAVEGTIDTCVSRMLKNSVDTNFGSPGSLHFLEEEERAIGWDVNITPTTSWTSIDLSHICPPGVKAIYGFAVMSNTDVTGILCTRCSCSSEDNVERTRMLQHRGDINHQIGFPVIIRAHHGKFDIKEYSAAYEVGQFVFRLHGWFRR